MTRTLLRTTVLCLLFLGSCAMPFQQSDSEFQAREITPPHKGGLADVGDGFSKYFLNHDPNSPFDYGRGSSFTSSIMSMFESETDNFGCNTRRPETYSPNYADQRCLGDSFLKYALERDSKDPYQ